MLKKILAVLEHIASLQWRILEQGKAVAKAQREILAQLERMDRPVHPAEEQAEAEKAPDAWLQAGLAGILGYQPNRRRDEE